MKKVIRIMSLMIALVTFHQFGFGQIKIVDDEYQPNLGGIEEIKLEELGPVPKEVSFDFNVGDSIYVLNSSHKMLCLNKNNRQASIKPLKTGMYVVTGCCFGDSIDRIHSLIDSYTFKNKNDKDEAHAIIYGMRIPGNFDGRHLYREEFNHRTNRFYYELKSGYPLYSDTIEHGTHPNENRAYRAKELVSFYQSKQGESFLKSVYKDKEYIRENGCSSPRLLIGVIYKIENENGEVFYLDKREVGFQGEKNMEAYYGPEARKILVLRMSDYQAVVTSLVGKDIYLSLNRLSFSSRDDRIKQVKDYITGKDIKITIASGDMLYDAIYDDLENSYSEESRMSLSDYYHCKDLFVRKGETVVILSNELGEFSAKLINSAKMNSDYYSISILSNDWVLELNLVPKELVDNRINDWQLSEQERNQKEQKEKEEQERKRAQYKANIIAKYGEKYGNLILQHKVAIGMTKEMCRDAWWFPNDTFTTITSRGESEVWVINYKTRLYFLDGVLYMIEN